MKDAVKKIQKVLNDNGIYAFVYDYEDEIRVEINWGDWKHDHAFADCLIEETFPNATIKTYVTDEDGSDCYSAMHCITNI